MMVVFQQANSNGKKKKYLGKIKYRVDYDFITSTLTVTVIECKVGIHYEQQNKGYARPETKSFDTYEFCINKKLWQLYNSMASGSHIKYQLGPRPHGP